MLGMHGHHGHGGRAASQGFTILHTPICYLTCSLRFRRDAGKTQLPWAIFTRKFPPAGQGIVISSQAAALMSLEMR
jgi:hypothetical protein